jgi:hypothetical protein
MFKEKTSKKRLNVTNNVKDNSTLDVIHNKMIKTFSIKSKEKHNNIVLLNDLLAMQDIIKYKIKTASENNIDPNMYNDLWTSNIKLSEQIIDIRNKLKSIDEYDEIEYYKKTSNILFDYYDMLEKQSNIKKVNRNQSKTILDALNNIQPNKTHIINENDQSIPDKTSLVDEYLYVTSKSHVKKLNHDDLEICKICKNHMTCLQHDAIIICDQCGYQELLLVEQNRPILKQNTKQYIILITEI